MPPFLRTNYDTPKGELVLAAGRDDDDRGLRVGYQSERYPRIIITPDGSIFTGDGLSEPVNPFGAGGSAHTIQEDGTSLPARTNLDFTTGVVAADTGAKTTVSLLGKVVYVQQTQPAAIQSGQLWIETAADNTPVTLWVKA